MHTMAYYDGVINVLYSYDARQLRLQKKATIGSVSCNMQTCCRSLVSVYIAPIVMLSKRFSLLAGFSHFLYPWPID